MSTQRAMIRTITREKELNLFKSQKIRKFFEMIEQ